jgi:4-amino-4-deoxy-L-arabinose transferase-like glycosyltransferase
MDAKPPSTAWKRLAEPHWAILLLVVAALYFMRLDAPNLRGEETRRGRVAAEMLQTGDWIVPRQQGQLFLSRPPLQNWLIALVGTARGGVDWLAIRLPCALATMLTALLIYGSARGCVSPAASLVAGVSFATSIAVLELGRAGETEAIFTLAVGGSLLIWHAGWSRGWPRALTWCLAYLLVAMGLLTKGPQAPVFFAGPVGLYLIATRRWRELFTWSHAAGLALFAGVWLAWQVPYFLSAGAAASWQIHTGDVAMRFEDSRFTTLLAHLVSYPLEIFACTLPWSPLLFACCRGGFWNWLGKNRDSAVFLLCCLVATFPICWFVPGARGRYYMPLFPCLAVLIGLAAEYSWLAAPRLAWGSDWRRLLAGLASVMAAAAVGVPLLGLIPATESYAQPWPMALGFAAGSLILAGIAFWSSAATTSAQKLSAPIAVAAFAALAYVGLTINVRDRLSNDTQQQVAAIKQRLPAGTRLVSLGLVYHNFTYYFEQPIEPLESLPPDHPWPGNTDYFCFKPLPGEAQKLNFAWEPVGTVTCDRNRGGSPQRVVVVARRLATKPATVLASRAEP